ncbi:MAG: aminotransferase class III-fold pyridoxal phosphate-dependent enzyme [Planktomarina sp.]
MDIHALNGQQLWQPTAHPGDVRSNPPRIITHAEGVRITDSDGHNVIDAVGGLWCANLGYSNLAVKDAIAAQLADLPYYSAFVGTSNPAAIEAAHAVLDLFAEDGMERAFFTSGGSDSVDTALRLARQYHRLRGQPQRTKFFSLKKGYHGTHWGGASVNGNPRFRQGYEPLLPGCFHLMAPYTYRNPFGIEDSAELAQKIAAQFEDEIIFQGPENIAAFIMEPILGAGGVIVPDPAFMGLMRDLCTKYGILFISDEVICGFGRTGHWSGSRHWGVKPDIMTCAKGITSGYFPVGATLLNGQVADCFENDQSGEGSIWHGYTYSAHPVGMAAVVACLAETKRLDLTTNAKAMGDRLFKGLQKLAAEFDCIGEVRGGHGLMCAIELVSDPKTKTPMAPDDVKRIHTAIYNAGTMVRMGGNNLMMSPPLVINEAEVDTILDNLRAGFAA